VGQKKTLLIALHWSAIGSSFHSINHSRKLNLAQEMVVLSTVITIENIASLPLIAFSPHSM
jgi:hypothetical protein